MEEYSLKTYANANGGITSPHELVFDFARSSSKYAVSVRNGQTRIAPGTHPQQAIDDESEQAPGTSRARYMLDLDRLPSPPLLGRLFGYSEQTMRSFVVTRSSSRFARLYAYLERAPTPDEVRLLAEYDAKDFRTASILPATYTGVLVGYGLFRPSKKWETGIVKAPVTGRVILEGSRAKLIQRFTRASMLGAVGLLLSEFMVAGTLRTFSIDAMKDPNLQEIRAAQTKALYAQRDAIRQNMQRGGSGEGHTGSGTGRMDPTGQGNTEMIEKWRRHRAGIGANDARHDPSDDSSSSQPESFDQVDTERGNFVPQADSSTDNAKPIELVSTLAGNVQSSGNRSAYSSWGLSRSKGTQLDASTGTDQGPNDFLFGNDTTSLSSSSSSSASAPGDVDSAGVSLSSRSLSAWERIRRGETARKDAISAKQGASSSDESTSSEWARNGLANEDVSRRREQEAFDKMLEQERGGNSESTSKEGKW